MMRYDCRLTYPTKFDQFAFLSTEEVKMLRILKLGLLYFALVFGAGFVLGPLRVLLLEPRLGARTAELLEMPLMLGAIWLASRGLVQRAQDLSAQACLGIGAIAVMLVLTADVAVGVFLRGMTVAEVFLRRDWVAGVAYYALLGLCGLMPGWQSRRLTRQPS